MPSITLLCMPRTSLQALANGDEDRAAAELGAPIPGEFSRERPVWSFFGNQLDEHPDWIGWTMHAVLESGRIVGHAGYHGPPVDGIVEVGYTTLSEHRGRGIARSVVAELIQRAEDEPDVHRVRACIAADNAPSLDVVRSHGFVHIGETEDEGEGSEEIWELLLDS